MNQADKKSLTLRLLVVFWLVVGAVVGFLAILQAVDERAAVEQEEKRGREVEGFTGYQADFRTLFSKALNNWDVGARPENFPASVHEELAESTAIVETIRESLQEFEDLLPATTEAAHQIPQAYQAVKLYRALGRLEVAVNSLWGQTWYLELARKESEYKLEAIALCESAELFDEARRRVLYAFKSLLSEW